ncbi:hypothetical protein NUW58_g158 [Xylaria curta]|uniref:Uncharacterized protein n=1 Tax=Xylaria curta TaxID=42375 RepID=A0ACC1PRP9_9PEZI|nr:hypothetical protein NUW58_g158 [Xylaria curta]
MAARRLIEPDEALLKSGPSSLLQAQALYSRSPTLSYSPSSPSTGFLSSPTLSTAPSSPSSHISSANNTVLLRSHRRASHYTTTISDEDRNWAGRLVAEQPSRSTWKAATAVLSNVVDGAVAHPTAELVQALLELGAEVCFERRKSSNILKVMLNKDQVDVRSNLLERATRNCSHDILFLLANNADEQGANQALPIAIDQDNPEGVRILLARGANASPWCNQFLNAVEFGSDEIISELMRNTNGACQSCRDRGLVRAATFGHAGKVQILLDHGADPSFERANALRAAISSGSEGIVILIASHKRMGSYPELLDMAIVDAYSQSNHRILTACLQAREGEPSEAINRILLQAVERNQLDLVTPLLQSNASVDYQGGAVVVAAVLSRDVKVLQAVLSSGKASQSSMSAAITQAAKSEDPRMAGHMIDALLSAGLRGDAVNGTLIRILDPKLAVGDDDSRLSLASLILEKGGADVNFQQGRALILAATGGWMKILSLLIGCQPSLASLRAAMPPIMKLKDNGRIYKILDMVMNSGPSNPLFAEDLKAAAVSSAAEALRLDVLEHVAQLGMSGSTILAGLSAAASSEREWTTPIGLSIIQFLLNEGALGPPVDEAFCSATRLFARDAVELLKDYISEECVEKALLVTVESSPEWHSPDDRNLWLIESLLDLGARGESVNIALLYALEAYIAKPKLASKNLVDILLTPADVNFRHGEALKIAIKGGDGSLLKELASFGASQETMTNAFYEAITAQLEEKKVLELLAVLNDRELEYQPDFKRGIPNRRPPIFDCLEAHPESVKLVEHLIKLGCEVDATTCAKLYNSTEPEYATALAWALSRSGADRTVSSTVITTLIDAKANVNFTAASSQTTPLILAARNSRGDIVKKLLEAKADTRSHDHFDKAALFYASRAGDTNTVKALLKREFRMNDGSLHEAARNLHKDCVTALIKAKYDPNFRSSREEYDGRTPLHEIAYRCDGLQKVTDMEATLWALAQGGADPLGKWQGKTALFLALCNPQPYSITQALLNTGKWCESNNPKNVFEERHSGTQTKFYFSPTVYLRRKAYDGNAATYAKLEKLLKTVGCEDRYYAELGSDQPDDAVGLPEEIAKEVKRRKDELDKFQRSEFEHQTKIRRCYEQEQAQHELWQAQQLEKTAQKISQSDTLHQNQLHHNIQISDQQQYAIARKNLITEQSLQSQQQLKLNFQQQTDQQKISSQEVQNRIAAEAQRQKLLNAQKTKALKASEERQMLKSKQAIHREELSFQKSMQDIKARRR